MHQPSPNFPERNQLQEASGNHLILPRIKEMDTKVLMGLLSPLINQQLANYMQQNNKSNTYVITDIGCGEGMMLNKLLEMLKDTLKTYLAIRIEIYACEPNENLLKKYKDNYNNNIKNQYPNIFLQDENLTKEPMENYTPPKSDFILASHCLYYTKAQWQNVECDKNLITRLLHCLKNNGCLAVILQSSQSTGIVDEKGGYVSNHEAYEHILYSILDKTLEPHLRFKNHANSEQFEEVIEANIHKKLPLQVQSEKSVVVIDLGSINFTPNELGQYPQSHAVTQLLLFYTRNKYQQLDGSDQLKLLNFIKDRCKTKEGQYVICHVNRIFVVCPKNYMPAETVDNSLNNESPAITMKSK